MSRLLFKQFFSLLLFACILNMASGQSAECNCQHNGSCIPSSASKGLNGNILCQCENGFIGGKCQLNGVQLKDQKELTSTLNNQDYKYFYISVKQENIYAFFFHLCFEKSEISSQTQQEINENQNDAITFFFQIEELNGYFDTSQNVTHPVTIQFQNYQKCKNIFIHYTPLAKTMLGELQKLIFAVKYGKPIKPLNKNHRMLSGIRQLNLEENDLNIRVLQSQQYPSSMDIFIDYNNAIRKQQQNYEKKSQNNQFSVYKNQVKENSGSRSQQGQAIQQDQNGQNSRKFKTQRKFIERQQEEKNQIKYSSLENSEKQQPQSLSSHQNIPFDKNIRQLNSNKSPIDANQNLQKEHEKTEQINLDQAQISQAILREKLQNKQKQAQNKGRQSQSQGHEILSQKASQQNPQRSQQSFSQTQKSQQQRIQSPESQQELVENIQKDTSTQQKAQKQKLISKQSQIKIRSENQMKSQQSVLKPQRIEKKVVITAMVYPFFDEDLIFNLLFSFTSIAGLLVLGAMAYIIRNRIIGIRRTMRIAARQKNNLAHFQQMIPPQKYADFSHKQISQQQCSICLTFLVDSDMIRYTPCQHIFHLGCLDSWCQQNLSCPMCRRSLKPANALQAFMSSSNLQLNPIQES